MRILYTIGIWFYTLGIRLAALLGHRNAGLMVKGWGETKEKLMQLQPGRPTAWFHAASLGEFEQARPVIEAYRQQHPGHQVLVTFFSPSGYEIRKNYAQAEAVCYLPPDLPRKIRRLINIAHPKVVFFVKYEFWFNYLRILRRKHIPTYIFSTIFRPNQYFFKWYGSFFRKQLALGFTHLFVQNEESLQLLKSHGITQCSLAGDTRFDRVHQIAEAAARNEKVEQWLSTAESGTKVIIAGSSWPPDEELISKYIETSPLPLRVILAPHVISEEHIKQIEGQFADSVRYSQLADNASPSAKILIIDNMGMLSQLYRYADVAYIGGGFGVGIHNILEAVTFGKPVLFGPNFHKFKEARDIIALGGGWSHSTFDQLKAHLDTLLMQPDAYQKALQACTQYMQQNLGSTSIILNNIEK